MERIMGLLAWDLRLQVRHHVLLANVVSTGFLCGFVLLLPGSHLPVKVASFFILSDPALIGLSFVGGMVLMEKASRVHAALAVTPLPPWIYVLSKAVTFTVSGTASGLLVAWAARGSRFDIDMMVFALVLSNAFAVLVGFMLVARAKSMNDLIIKLLYGATLLFLPLLGHFQFVPRWAEIALMPIPSAAMLNLFDSAMAPEEPSGATLYASAAYLLACIGAAWWWSLREYRTAMTDER